MAPCSRRRPHPLTYHTWSQWQSPSLSGRPSLSSDCRSCPGRATPGEGSLFPPLQRRSPLPLFPGHLRLRSLAAAPHLPVTGGVLVTPGHFATWCRILAPPVVDPWNHRGWFQLPLRRFPTSRGGWHGVSAARCRPLGPRRWQYDLGGEFWASSPPHCSLRPGYSFGGVASRPHPSRGTFR